jgi:hypothetical protein
MRVSHRRRVQLMVLAAAACAPAAAAHAGERLGVLILPVQQGDTALADSVTEVAISRLAETTDHELVGVRELRRRLSVAGGAELPLDCAIQTACLARVGVILGVRRLVSGSVRPDKTGFTLSVAMHDITSGKVERSFFRSVEGGPEALARAVQQAIDDLFGKQAATQLRVTSVPGGATVVLDDQRRGTTPLTVEPLEPGRHRVRIEMTGRFPWKNEVTLAPGQNLLVSVSRDELAPRRVWTRYAAYGSAGGAALSLGAAAVFGILARMSAGASRGDAQMDLQVRKTYATTTNALLVTGGALALVSAVVFVAYRRDVAGE